MTSNNNYEYIEKDSIDQNLICEICHNPFIDPFVTSCFHTFCHQCIEEYLKTSAICPSRFCNHSLSINDVKPLDPGVVISMLNRLQVKCKLCDQPDLCRQDFNKHINENCHKVIVKCPTNDIGCEWEGQRDELNNHLETCVVKQLRPFINRLHDDFQRHKAELEKRMNQQCIELEPNTHRRMEPEERMAPEKTELKQQIDQQKVELERMTLKKLELEERMAQEKTELTQQMDQQKVELKGQMNQQKVDLQRMAQQNVELEKRIAQEKTELKQQIDQQRVELEGQMNQQNLGLKRMAHQKAELQERITQEKAELQERITQENAEQKRQLDQQKIELERQMNQQKGHLSKIWMIILMIFISMIFIAVIFNLTTELKQQIKEQKTQLEKQIKEQKTQLEKQIKEQKIQLEKQIKEQKTQLEKRMEQQDTKLQEVENKILNLTQETARAHDEIKRIRNKFPPGQCVR